MTQIDINYAGEGIYRDNILDHYRNPRNFGNLNNPNLDFQDFNPLCGDKIEVFFKFNNEKIEDIKFKGYGCAISIASSSMIIEAIKGKGINEIINMEKQNVFDLLNIPLTPIRIKCALLGFIAIKKALCKYKHLEFEDEIDN